MPTRSATSWVTLLVLVLISVAAYGRALGAGFPIDAESVPWLRHLAKTPWPAVPTVVSYHNVVPVGNVALKVAAGVYSMDARAGQALGVGLVVVAAMLVGRLALLLFDGGKPTSIAAASLFAASTAYYHLVLSPLNVCAAGVFYVLVLAALVLAVTAARTGSTRSWIGAAIIGALLPLQFYGAPSFLPLLAATLWMTGLDLRPRARAIAAVAIVHVVVLALSQLFLTGIFSSHFVESQVADPSRFGLSEVIAAHPLQFFSVVARNAAGAYALGLVAPFFLLSPPAGAWGIAGAMALALWLLAIVTWRDGRRANVGLLAMSMIPLLVTCVLRNPFNIEQGVGKFDLYWVVSMPRYYFFPSVGLALSFAASVFALGFRFGWPGRVAVAVLSAALVLGNVATTSTKLAILRASTPPGASLPSEVFRFTSPLVHPAHPVSELEAPSPGG